MIILNSDNLDTTHKIINRLILHIDSSKFFHIGQKTEKKELKEFVVLTREELEDAYEVKLNKDEKKILDHYIYQKWLDYSRSPEGQKIYKYHINCNLITKHIVEAQQNSSILIRFLNEADNTHIADITLETLIEQNNQILINAVLSEKIISPKLSHALIAVHKKNIDVLEILEHYGLDLYTYNNRLLEIAIRYAYEDIQRFLVKNNMTVVELIGFAKNEGIGNIEKTAAYQYLEKKEFENSLEKDLKNKNHHQHKSKI